MNVINQSDCCMKNTGNIRMKLYYSIFLILFVSNSLNSQTIYKTPSGAKYHRESCKHVNNVSKALTVSEAVKIGLQPCKVCNPPVSSIQNFVTPQNKAKGEGQAVRCKAKTKQGTRCKRMTRIANSYCFQHQPK